jgi:flagellar hook-associated protein 3 FlgL
MINRLGSLEKFTRTMDYTQGTQYKAFDLQRQITSGQKSNVYSGISDDTGRLLKIERTLTATEQYKSNITVVRARLQTSEVQLSSMMDNAIKFKSTLTQALNNGNASLMALAQQSDQLMTQTANLLNTSQSGVYLFSGGRTTTPPVDLLQFNAAANATSLDAGYYQGDQDAPQARIDEDFLITYGVKADDEAFEKYFRAMRLVKANETDPTTLRAAMDLMDQAITRLNTVTSTIGAASNALDVSEKRHNDNLVVLKETVGSIEDTNILEASSKLSQEELQLQASYSVIARLSRLSIINYLN